MTNTFQNSGDFSKGVSEILKGVSFAAPRKMYEISGDIFKPLGVKPKKTLWILVYLMQCQEL